MQHRGAGLHAGERQGPIPLRVLVAGGTVAVAIYAAWLLVDLGGDRVTLVVDDAGSPLAAVLAAVLTGARSRVPAARSTRRGWALLSGTCVLFALGDAAYGFYQLALGTDVPFPSLADVAYVAGSCVGIAAVLSLVGSHWTPSRFRLLLDGSIVAGSLLLLSWLTTMHAVYQAGAGSPLKLALSLAYPILDVVTAMVIISAVSHVDSLDPALGVVAVGMLLLAVTDSLFTYLANLDLYGPTDVIDAGYMAAYLTLGAASLVHRGPRTRDAGAGLSRWQTALPYAPLAVAGAMVLANVVTHHAVDLVSQTGLAAVVALVLVRQLMAVIESQSLTARLDATVVALQDALERWKDASAERETLIDQAPVGICRLDSGGRLVSVNRKLEEMLGLPAARFAERPLSEFLAPVDGPAAGDGLAAATLAGREPAAVELRGTRSDGATVRCWAVLAPLVRPAGHPERLVGIVEDVTERRLQTERAAHVQRQLLPQSVPQVDGYELAGTCLPAEDVAGDLYDWMAADGRLDLTLADVMGKGVAAALVMAVLRTALRSASPGLGPAARVRLVADALDLGMGGEGLFATLFHARLVPDTGVLRYVDAGHGYCAIRRAGGEVVHLGERCLPVGLQDGELFREGTVELLPGDALVVYSDGLVESVERTATIEELTVGLDPAASADQIVRRLMARVQARPADDVTVLALRRLPARREPAPATWSSYDVVVELAAVPEQLDALHDGLERFWRQLDRRPSSHWRLLFELAVAEIAANIIEHARPDLVEFRLTTDGQRVTAAFQYDGPGWTDPDEPVRPGALAERGRGLYLAKTGVDEVAYSRTGSTVLWRLVKRL